MDSEVHEVFFEPEDSASGETPRESEPELSGEESAAGIPAPEPAAEGAVEEIAAEQEDVSASTELIEAGEAFLEPGDSASEEAFSEPEQEFSWEEFALETPAPELVEAEEPAFEETAPELPEAEGFSTEPDSGPEEAGVPADSVALRLVPEDGPIISLPDAPSRRQEGLKVRVIGAGSGISSRESEARGPRRRPGAGLEIGMRIGGGGGRSPSPEARETSHPDAEEEVTRLEAAPEEIPSAVPADKPDASPAVVAVHSRARRGPGRKKRLTVRQWTIGMSIGTAFCVIAAVFVSQLRPKPVGNQQEQRFDVEKVVAGQDEQAEFVRNIGSYSAEARTVLERFAAAGSAAEALKEVREADRVRSAFTAQWQPWSQPAFHKTGRGEDPVIIANDIRCALVLRGERGDFSPYTMVFVRENGRMVVDWEASYGIGDAPIASLTSTPAEHPLTMRFVIKPDSFYNPAFPETAYRSFQLLDSDGDHFVWGYVPLATPVDEKLTDLLSIGSNLSDSLSQANAILRIQRPEGAGSNQFLILDLVQPGWVAR